MSTNPNDKVAIGRVEESLARAALGLQQRLDSKSDERRSLVSRRREQLQALVERTVPDLSGATHEALVARYPTLNTTTTRACFGQRKILGLFETTAYREALNHVRISLAAVLDAGHGTGVDSLKDLADAIVAIDTERGELKARLDQVQKLLENTQRARLSGATSVPASALPSAFASRPVARPAAKRRSGSYGYSASSYVADDDTDLWLYYLTDIPTSGRTLLMDAFDMHFSQSSGYSNASDTVSSGSDTSSGFSAGSDASLTPGQAAGIGAAAFVTGESIAHSDFATGGGFGSTPDTSASFSSDSSPFADVTSSVSSTADAPGNAFAGVESSVSTTASEPYLPSFDNAASAAADSFGAFS